MDVSVIVPARDAQFLLGDCLRALAGQETAATFEVIVVDDGSVDRTAAVAEAAGPRVRLVRGTGTGPAAARNLGAAGARGRVLAFTDADCRPAAGWLDAALATVDGGADLVQGAVVPAGPCGRYDRVVVVAREHGLYETANLLVRRELFDRLGGFESILRPRRGIELGEDVWFGWRARRSGARVVFCESATVRHEVFPRGPWGFVAERARLRFFPELVARIPELREVFLHRRVFLNARTARFDLALAGAGIAAVLRRPWPLAATVPYLRATRDPVCVAADAVGAASLLYGSLRARSPVL
jgi:glycosyltransferase involved in cell wall biosynthesis